MKKCIVGLIVCVYSFSAGAQPSAVADSLYALGNYAEAINYYAKVPESRNLMQIARAYNAMGNYKKAIVQYEHTIAKNNALHIAAFELGKLYVKMRQWDKAGPIFTALMIRDTLNPEYAYYLGRIFQSQPQHVKAAVLMFKRAVYLDSTHLRSLFQIGKYYLNKKVYDSVLKYTDKGLRVYEDASGLLSLKAQTLFNRKNFKEAIPCFERLVALKQDKNFILSKLAKAYVNEKAFEKAVAVYTILLERNPETPEMLYELGMVYKKQKKYELAIEHITASVEVRSFTFAHEYGTIAEIYRVQQDFKKALHYYLLAHKENPEDPRFYFQACVMAEKQHKDVTAKLRYYLSFKEKYSYLGDDHFYIQLVDKCIKSIKSRP